MDNKIVKFKKLSTDAKIPTRADSGSAGYDLYANESVELWPGDRKLVSLGFSAALPHGYEGQIRPRSGLALKSGLTVLNAPGTVDSTYRGEWKVLLYNASDDVYLVNKGDRIAQLVIAQYTTVIFDEVPELPSTDRGAGGFGSSGK